MSYNEWRWRATAVRHGCRSTQNSRNNFGGSFLGNELCYCVSREAVCLGLWCLQLGAVKEVMMLQWQKVSVTIASKMCMYVVVMMGVMM